MRFALVALLAAVAAPAFASPTKSFRVTNFKELDEGEGKGVMLSSLGEATPGLGTTRLEISAASVATSAVASDGTIYLGTSEQGDVFRYKAGKLDKLAKLDLSMVAALAVGADGTLYAGGVGAGKVFAIDKSGKAKELAKVDGDHVWALILDEKTKTLYVGTGPNGRLFAIDLATAKSRLVYEFADKHLFSMARADDGSLIVGSSEQAIVWRIWPTLPTPRVITLHDFEGDEIKALWRDGKSVFVAVNEFSKSGASATSVPAPTKGGTKISASGTTTAALPPTPTSRDRKGKGAVYRLDDDGRLEQLLATSDGYFTSLAPAADHAVYATSGANGKVYLLKSDRSVQTVIDVPERQALTFATSGDESILGTGDAAAVYRVTSAPKDPTYTSKVFDAQFAARWGNVRWSGRGALRTETRIGNTAKPDKTWSAWQATSTSAPQKLPHGGANKIVSDGARYIQARVLFAGAGKDAVLHDLQIFYTPQNQRPRVTEITVLDDAHKPLGVKPTRTRATTVKLRWKVENPDDDELVYRVHYREETEVNWKLLGGSDPLTKAEYDWNTESVGDGHYLVRVTASDERANAKEDTLEHSLVSDPILIDNKKPEVAALVIKQLNVTGNAHDSYSPIAEISYSVDGGDWQPVAAKDGVFDDLSEDFAFKIVAPELNKGAHTLAVRAVDSADNIGITQLNFAVN